jgi:hypothetical protein
VRVPNYFGEVQVQTVILLRGDTLLVTNSLLGLSYDDADGARVHNPAKLFRQYVAGGNSGHLKFGVSQRFQ